MIDEKLDERIQKFAQSTRLNDAGRRAGFEGYQPTQSMADRQGEASPVAQNVPPPPPRPAPPPIQTRADTNLPRFSNGSVSRDAGGLHTGRYVTQKDFDEGNAQVEAYKRAHPERTGYRPNVTSNRYGAWHKRANTLGAGSDGSMGAWSQGGTMNPVRPSARGFIAAAQQPAQSPAAQGGGTDLAATNARAKAMRQQAADQEAQGREKMDGLMGQALTTLLGEWRQNGATEAMADPMNGKQTWAFRVARLEPATLRQINEQRQSFGLRDTDKVIGMMAVGDSGADGKTGTPSFYLRYRDANGRVHTRVATYEQAARQYAMAHMKANGSTDAAYDLANNETWNDPLRYKNTGAYLDTQAKIDSARMQNEAASLKNDLMRQQIAAANKPESERLLDRADALAGKDPEQSAAYRQQAQIAAANEEIARRKAANGSSSVHKSNPQKAGSEGAGQKPQKPGAKPPTASGESASESAPPAATSVQEKPPTASGKDTEELDYDSPAMQAQVKKDIESGGGKYSEDDEGNRTIRIGNWDYLSDADKKIVREVQADENGDIDIRAVHAMQKKANEAKTAFDKKRKAEEDKFRESLKGKGLTSVAIDNRVKKHMMGWDARNDPKKKRQINDSRFSGFVSDF